jgi:periplasmic protein TonB
VAPSNEMADDTPEPAPNFADLRPTRFDEGATADSTTVTRLLGGADPAFAPGVLATNSAGLTGSGVLAVAAHALVFFALVATPPRQYGGGGVTLEAISVSIVSANALQSQQPSTESVARAAPDQLAKTEGDDTASSTAAPDKPAPAVHEPPREPPEPRPDDIEKAQAAPAAAPDAPALEPVPDVVTTTAETPKPPEPVAEPEKIAMVEPPPRPTPPDTHEKPPEDEVADPSPDASAAGGAPSRGVAPDLPPSAAAAAASRGEIHAYGRAVQDALLAVDQHEAKARFAAARAKGTVVVRLVISVDGALERAEIATSSGRRALDDIAIGLMRLIAFPRPPSSLAAADRVFLAPIEFK